jgi:uncharacterized membrane protein YfcA
LLTPAALALVASAFVLGGFVKGTLGVGLPLVAVPLMTLVLPGHRAIGLVVIPVLLSNLMQAWECREGTRQTTRFLPLIGTMVLTTLLTVRLTLDLSEAALARMLGGAVLVAVVLMMWRPTLRVSPRSESWWGAGVGLLSGMLGGVSSLTGPLIISYLMSLRLPRDVFVGSISVIYLCAAAPLYAAMLWHGRIGLTEVMYSAVALLPMWLGLRVGRACRHRLSERAFSRLLLAFLSVLALVLFFR